jgi:hypothetical protein
MLLKEANTLKKLLIYSATAAVIGLILALAPVSLVALTETERDYATPLFFSSKGLEKLEGTSESGVQKYSINEIAILAISFIIAFFAYALFKFRMLH